MLNLLLLLSMLKSCWEKGTAEGEGWLGMQWGKTGPPSNYIA